MDFFSGANTIVPSIWGSKAGPFMQALYLSYTVGGIVCPLLTRPFMTTRIDDITSYSQEKIDRCSADTFDLHLNNEEISPKINATPYEHNVTREFDIGNENEILRIHFAFILIGTTTLLTAIPYFVMPFLGNYDVRISEDSDETSRKRRAKVSKYRMCCIIMFVCAVNILYAATEDCVGAFLVTFSLQQLHWSKTQSVILLALYWSTSCIGGLIGVFIVQRLGLARMTFAAYFLWIVSFLCALVCAQFEFYAFGFSFLYLGCVWW